MGDLLGYRALIGAVMPSDNTVVLPDFVRPNVTGVTAHGSDFDIKTENAVGAIEEAVTRALAKAPIRVGLAIDEMITGTAETPAATLTQPFEGRDLTLPLPALLAALACFGPHVRVALLSPFAEGPHAAAVALLREHGVQIVSDVAAGSPSAAAMARTSYVMMRALYDHAVATGRPDVVVQIGHNLPMARLVSNLEEDHGRPVLAINTVLLWKMLRDGGIQDPIPGSGTLLFQH